MALIIPDSVNAANAGPRLAFAIAKSKFQAAAAVYEEKGGKRVPSRLRALEECFDRVESTFMATLKDHPKRDEIGKCVEAFVRFGAIVTRLERELIPSFHPAARIEVLDCFLAWEAAEKEYAAMGFKTVSTKDLFMSLLPMGFAPKIHPPLYTFLMIEREPGEEPVYHAAAFAELYAKDLAAAKQAKAEKQKADAEKAADLCDAGIAEATIVADSAESSINTAA